MCHATACVILSSAAKAGNRLFVIETKGPVQAAIKPALCLCVGAGDGAAVAAQIVGVVHDKCSGFTGAVWQEGAQLPSPEITF